jgi:hypothetical protein
MFKEDKESPLDQKNVTEEYDNTYTLKSHDRLKVSEPNA